MAKACLNIAQETQVTNEVETLTCHKSFHRSLEFRNLMQERSPDETQGNKVKSVDTGKPHSYADYLH